VVLFLQVLLCGQFLVPGALQVARHQPVLRLNGVILAPSALCLVGRALPALLPQAVAIDPRAFDLLGGFQGEFEGGGLQRGEHLGTHILVEAGSGELLAQRGSIVCHVPAAHVGVPLPLSVPR